MSIFLHGSEFSGSREARFREDAPRAILATIEREHGDTGVHAHTRALIDGLKAAGVDCELANPFIAGPKWLPLFAVRKVLIKPVNKTWSLRWYRHWHYAALCESLTRALLRRNADVVIAQCPVSARAALEVRRRTRGTFRIAMVCHFNYSEATEYRDKGELQSEKAFQRMLKLEGMILRSVDQLIYVSNWAQEVVEKDRGIAPQSSRVIWNGVATDVQTPPITRQQIGVGENDLMLINVGSLEPRKNQIQLLDVFAHLRAANPTAKLVLVGDGPQRAEIEEKIRRHNLSDDVRVLGHRTDVPALLKLADIYVHYSRLENCPVILLEAARAGLPIAAVPTGGVGEIGRKLGNIVHLSEASATTSAAAMENLLKDKSARQTAGAQARHGFEQHFTRNAMVAQYLEALELKPAEVVR